MKSKAVLNFIIKLEIKSIKKNKILLKKIYWKMFVKLMKHCLRRYGQCECCQTLIKK